MTLISNESSSFFGHADLADSADWGNALRAEIFQNLNKIYHIGFLYLICWICLDFVRFAFP
jgi:hypothetical protein